MIACQTASHLNGVIVDIDAGRTLFIDSATQIWNISNLGIDHRNGDLFVGGGTCLRDVGAKGVLTNNAAANLFLDNVVFDTMPTAIDTPAAATVTIGDGCSFIGTITNVQTNEKRVAVASASSVTLPKIGKVFDVTGTTSIGTLVGSGVPQDKVVTLVFTSGLTVNHSSTGVNLRGGVNKTFAAGETLTLMFASGNKWHEI
jgi:hypothetical protein